MYVHYAKINLISIMPTINISSLTTLNRMLLLSNSIKLLLLTLNLPNFLRNDPLSIFDTVHFHFRDIK